MEALIIDVYNSICFAEESILIMNYPYSVTNTKCQSNIFGHYTFTMLRILLQTKFFLIQIIIIYDNIYYLTTYHSTIGVVIIVVFDLERSTLSYFISKNTFDMLLKSYYDHMLTSQYAYRLDSKYFYS